MLPNLNLMKLAQIFSPSPTMPNQGVIQQPNTVGMNTPLDINELIKGLLTPKDEAFTNYTNMINSMPQREQFAPSKTRQILGAIAGMGAGGPVGISNGAVLGYKSDVPAGMKIAQGIRDEPYNKALTDWANKLGPAGKLAELERNTNVNSRIAGIQTLQRQQADDKLQHQIQKDEEDQRRKNEELKIKQQRADVYSFKAQNPNLVIKDDGNGNMVGINPQTGETKVIRDIDGEPVKSARLTDAERLELQQSNALARIKAQGDETRTTAELRAKLGLTDDWDILTENGKTYRVNSSTGERVLLSETELKKVSGTGNTAKPDNPTQIKQDRINKANDFILKNPELAKFIEISDGLVKIIGKPDETTRRQITAGIGLESSTGKDIALPSNQPSSRTLTREPAKGSQVGDPIRDRAVEILKAGGKPLTDANIRVIMDRIKAAEKK